MIEMLDITKRFGALPALEHVSLRIEGGQVHGLLGENGAGKSTLMNILFGLLTPDEGRILVDNKEVRITSPRAAQSLGIGMVHQHFKLVPTLTVLQNFSIALRASVKKLAAPTANWLTQLGWQVPLNERVENLSVGQQQRVEIVKALMAAEMAHTPSHTLILDEPTAVLTPQEATELFTALQTLKKNGTAIVFISHKLGEVERVCDVVTILRRGKVVHTGPTSDMKPADMAEKMVGAKVELPRLHPSSLSASVPQCLGASPPTLTLKHVTAGLIKNASLEIHPSQILGIAGVDGNGQSDLVQAIIGGIDLTSGEITLCNEPATDRSIRWRMERLAYIAEDRQRQAVVMPLSITDNLLLKDYRQKKFSTLGWLRFGAWRTQAQNLVQRFDIRTSAISDPVARLSGGNQQKVVLARELYNPEKRLVIAVNPTRGLDIGATAFVMQQLLDARARGAAVLLIHSDLDELLAISDTVQVLYNGALQQTYWPKETKEGIGRLMLGIIPTSDVSGGAA